MSTISPPSEQPNQTSSEVTEVADHEAAEKVHTTTGGIKIYVDDGETVADHPDGSRRIVDGDVFDVVSAVAELLRL